MKQVLLLGADGMLGRAWEEFLLKQNIQHDAVSRHRSDGHRLDISDTQAVRDWLAKGYRWVVNCAAYTAVDAAEQDEATATAINAHAVQAIALAAKEYGARLVHYSTDYVFSGEATEPYPVDAPIAPQNAYGRSKAAGEAAVFNHADRPLVIRTSWVYGPWGNNFVLTMSRLLREKPQLRVVHDQRGRPTSILALVRNTWSLMNANVEGAYHVCDGGECTWFELTCELKKRLAAPAEVLPCTTDEFPRPARRPAYSVLDLSRTEAVIGPIDSWQVNLGEVLQRLSAQ